MRVGRCLNGRSGLLVGVTGVSARSHAGVGSAVIGVIGVGLHRVGAGVCAESAGRIGDLPSSF